MKRVALFGGLVAGIIITISAYSQCQKTHYFCTDQLTKEEQAEFWNLNNQSKSATFAKGQTYEMSFIGYKGFQYRLSVCTDIIEGASEKVKFQLYHDALIKKKDANGNVVMRKEKEAIYNNESDNMKQFVKFVPDKTKKFYVEVEVPATGKSADRKLGPTDNVCVGVLIEHKETDKLGF